MEEFSLLRHRAKPQHLTPTVEWPLPFLLFVPVLDFGTFWVKYTRGPSTLKTHLWVHKLFKSFVTGPYHFMYTLNYVDLSLLPLPPSLSTLISLLIISLFLPFSFLSAEIEDRLYTRPTYPCKARGSGTVGAWCWHMTQIRWARASWLLDDLLGCAWPEMLHSARRANTRDSHCQASIPPPTVRSVLHPGINFIACPGFLLHGCGVGKHNSACVVLYPSDGKLNAQIVVHLSPCSSSQSIARYSRTHQPRKSSPCSRRSFACGGWRLRCLRWDVIEQLLELDHLGHGR